MTVASSPEDADRASGQGPREHDRPIFFYDLGSPYAYLTAERISALFDPQPEWQPILLGGLFKIHGRSSWADSDQREAGIAEVERRAAAYGLPELRWPEPWPGNMLTAMRAATFAKQIGKTVAFSQAAFRQAFAAGRDLGQLDNVLVAAAACEIHPNALTAALELQSVKDQLRAATERAAAHGVIGVPSVVVGAQVFWGDDRLEEAAIAAS